MTWEISQRSLALLGALFLVSGFLLGGVYDIFRIRRRATSPGVGKKRGAFKKALQGFFVGIEDLLFFIFAGALASVLCFALFQGRVRLFAIALGVLGFMIWRLTLGRLIMALADAIINLFRAALSFVSNRILKPPARAVKRLFGRTIRIIQNAAKRRRRKRYSKARMREILKASEKGFIQRI